MMNIDDYWKRGFWYYVKFPLYLVYQALGIVSTYDEYSLCLWNVEVYNELERLHKRIEKLEKKRK